MAKNFYYILGVTSRASIDEIKIAYRRMAKRCHPDRNSGSLWAEERFKEIHQAYEVLADQEKRSEYDLSLRMTMYRFNRRSSDGMGRTQTGGERREHRKTQSSDPENAFRSEQDRETSASGTPIRGRDISQKIQIPLELAAKGGGTRIWIDQEVSCSCCEGSGAKPGTRIRRCYRCQGLGWVTQLQDSVSTTQVCPLCSGRGTVFRIPCPECKGSGLTLRKGMVSVPVQPGVRSGDRIHLEGQGHPGRFGGPSGDLYLSVQIQPHPEFRRMGYHIETTAKVDIVTATLGGRVIVPTLNGNAYVVIPPGSRSGTRLRLKGKGLLRPDGDSGDQYIVVAIVPPRNVTEEQKKLLWQFRKIGK